MTAVREPAEAGGVGDQEFETRLASIRLGIWLSAIVCIGCGVYALGTWDQPNRSLILVTIAIGLISAPLMFLLPLERIIRGPWREVFFVAWSAADIALITVCAGLDGGSTSPFVLLLIMPFLFASLSYPLRPMVTTFIVEMVALLILAFAVGGGLPFDGFGLFAALCVAALGGWEARSQARRRRALGEAAGALVRSEESSRLQAQQQSAVARFGQQALEGAEINELGWEACRILTDVLDIDYGGVLKLLPGGDELLLVSGVGLPEAMIGEARVPADERSQSGYALATGQPTVVDDWNTETRYQQSALQSQQNMQSAAVVLIQGKAEPYGVLGAGSRALHGFSEADVNFMQAIANVLANAVERRRTEERTRHEALHDPLTGLPNRNLFLDRLQHALSAAARREASIAVLFLDLDQFKLVNDRLGHAEGDELLAAVAPRIEQALRPGDTVARFGGDEFAVLAEDVGDERGATRIAERIAEALARPFILREHEHFVSTSIGISIGTGAEPPEALIRDADSALYRAKEHGRGGYEIFDEVMRSRVIEHTQTENDLRVALQRGELVLHYQPVVRLQDGVIASMEALVRWDHPERGLIGPLAFLPVAEDSRLIVPMGRWVIEQACRQAAAWQRLEPDAAPVSVSVNLSARQLADPELIPHLEGSISASGIDPSTLWLELTESTLLDDAAYVERTLGALKRLGVCLVMDNFGVGFSSLGYLKRLPLSIVKLDRTFLEHVTDRPNDAAIVRAVSEMAETLGIGVVAEGVETDEQVRAARELGCGYAQGFHFSEPVPGSYGERLLAGPMHVFP